MGGMYHDASRRLQQRFDTRRLADRLADVEAHTTFRDEDRRFIERCPMFFLATADLEGRPDCSYKGGEPGFVRVLDETTLAFPDYDGNGMFKSLGNIEANPNVGLLFIDFERRQRLRVNGAASLHLEDPLLSDYPGARLIVRVQPSFIFPNCPRYIHKMTMVKASVYTPRAGYAPPIPNWKKLDDYRDVLPEREGRVRPGLATYAKRLERKSGALHRLIRALRDLLHRLGLR
jgi:uncharacterized protein